MPIVKHTSTTGSTRWLDVLADTPALLVDLDVFTANLREMRDIAKQAGVELLPHAKTHRMTRFGTMQIDYGADGLCVAKLGEAEAFADAGIPRMMVAYPLVGAAKTRRALALHHRVDMTFATDSEAGARELGACFAADGETARIVIAIDSGLGREGVSFAAAPDLADRLATLPGIELVGIFTHEGSVYGAEDRADLERRALEIATAMVRVAEEIRSRGHALPVVSLGASASARIVASVPGVTQIRPGIYAFNDLGQIALGNATLDSCAIRVIATVVSHPEPGRACVDAGSKALSADLVPTTAHREEFPGYGLLVGASGWCIERLSEEHAWLRWHGDGEPTALPVGTRLEIVPNHACMVFASLRRASIMRDGIVTETWDSMGPGSSE